MIIKLTCGELRHLLRNQNGTGGFQQFLTQLSYRVNDESGELDLDLEDLNRIRRYHDKYGKGGFQGRLRKIFNRTLGKTLGWK